MNDILLKAGILRRVAITKNGDLDLSLRFTGEPDSSYTLADKILLEEMWKTDELLDVTLKPDESSHFI